MFLDYEWSDFRSPLYERWKSDLVLFWDCTAKYENSFHSNMHGIQILDTQLPDNESGIQMASENS